MDILKNKKTVIKNGEEIIDFSEPTYMPDEESDRYEITRMVTLSKDYEMRPDLVCNTIFNSTDNFDLLLKINEISDPLSILGNETFLIPSRNSMSAFFVTPEEERENININLDSSKVSKKDKSRLEYLKKISQKIKNGSTENTKVNELKGGNQNITIDNQNNSFIV